MPTTHLVVIALGAVLIGGPSNSVSNVPPIAIDVSADQDEADQDAVRFRQAFGLDASIDLVRAARRDKANYSDELYGIPLSRAELAEMHRRAVIQSAMEPALEEAQRFDTFAGAYIDQLRRGRPVFMFTSIDPSIERRLGGLLPPNADLEVIRADRTEREILTLQDRIIDDWDALERAGVRLVRVAVATDANTLVVGVRGKTPEGETRLKAEYGSFLQVVEANVAHGDSCPATDDCRPMKGGIAINHAGGSPGECTSGFVVKKTDNGAWAILTAGHCIEKYGGFDVIWRHNGQGFGRGLYETFIQGGEGDGDVGLISIQSPEWPSMTNKNQIRRKNGTGTLSDGSVANVTGHATALLGMQMCRVRVSSLHDCGKITHTDVAHWSEVAGMTRMRVLHTIEYDFDSAGGDSGGPVFFYPAGGANPVTMLGTHVHSWDEGDPLPKRSWATPYLRGRSAYASLFPSGNTYNVCVTAAC